MDTKSDFKLFTVDQRDSPIRFPSPLLGVLRFYADGQEHHSIQPPPAILTEFLQQGRRWQELLFRQTTPEGRLFATQAVASYKELAIAAGRKLSAASITNDQLLDPVWTMDALLSQYNLDCEQIITAARPVVDRILREKGLFLLGQGDGHLDIFRKEKRHIFDAVFNAALNDAAISVAEQRDFFNAISVSDTVN